MLNSHHRRGHKYSTSLLPLWLHQKRSLAHGFEGQWWAFPPHCASRLKTQGDKSPAGGYTNYQKNNCAVFITVGIRFFVSRSSSRDADCLSNCWTSRSGEESKELLHGAGKTPTYFFIYLIFINVLLRLNLLSQGTPASIAFFSPSGVKFCLEVVRRLSGEQLTQIKVLPPHSVAQMTANAASVWQPLILNAFVRSLPP